jgi:hypothetical protein
MNPHLSHRRVFPCDDRIEKPSHLMFLFPLTVYLYLQIPNSIASQSQAFLPCEEPRHDSYPALNSIYSVRRCRSQDPQAINKEMPEIQLGGSERLLLLSNNNTQYFLLFSTRNAYMIE